MLELQPSQIFSLICWVLSCRCWLLSQLVLLKLYPILDPSLPIAYILSCANSCFLNQLYTDDKYHPEEVQSFIHATSLSVLPLSSNYTFRHWTIFRWAPNQPECVCFQVHFSSCGKSQYTRDSTQLNHWSSCFRVHIFTRASFVYCSSSSSCPASYQSL